MFLLIMSVFSTNDISSELNIRKQYGYNMFGVVNIYCGLHKAGIKNCLPLSAAIKKICKINPFNYYMRKSCLLKILKRRKVESRR